MSFEIDTFWKERLAGIVRPTAPVELPGWTVEAETNRSFVEADLALRADAGDLSQPIWFVAAPGAVGKSTLAREISARTGAVYLDLAKADTVAGNYVTGGVVKAGLLDAWRSNAATVLIDALDEARLRVTQGSFEDFLRDARAMAAGRKVPIVLFGRVGVVEEAWLSLADQGLLSPIFDVSFFDRPRSVAFVIAALERMSATRKYSHLGGAIQQHRSVYIAAAEKFVIGLENSAPSDGARFSGYAPVLEAVAAALAEVTNPSKIDQAVQEAMQGQILLQLTQHILLREAQKLRAQLPASMSQKDKLYTPSEQLSRLGVIVLQAKAPQLPISLTQADFAAYDGAVNDFMPIHPFLDGTGHAPSGAVFAAAISAHSLFSPDKGSVATAERYVSAGPHTPNPFLVDFYLSKASEREEDSDLIAPEHIVAIYESIQARAGVGDIVRLNIDGDDDSEHADVEIQISNGGKNDSRILFRTSQAGTLRFGRQISGVAVQAPLLDVVVGSGNSVELIAPVLLDVQRLTFDCPEVVIARSADSEDGVVMINATELVSSNVRTAPRVREGTVLQVSWPNANLYPWAQFEATTDTRAATNFEDLFNLSRLVLAFRSHSRGSLARFKDKVEHVRMTKGPRGVALREKLWGLSP